ncbi:MAG: PKD domain-containing protein, partial [Nanoarchaeota archaeon]|nr:PKD domain-containing protein [Nanoarchaeota archaeon]
MGRGVLFFLLSISLMFSLVSAVEVSNQTFISSNYLEGDSISGKLYVRFDGDYAGKLSSNLDGGIDVLDLLKMSNLPNTSYSCEPSSCLEDYKIGLGTESKEKPVYLDDELNKEVYGFYIEENGEISEITDMGFDVDLEVGPGCVSQIVIDLLNDGIPDFYNVNYDEVSCFREPYTPNYGCFEDSSSDTSVFLSKDSYCESVKNIPAGPAYRIGTNLALVEGGEGDIFFSLYYPSEGGFLEGKSSQAVTDPSSGEVSAIVEHHSLEPFDGVICVSQKGGDAKYKIRTESGGAEQCGIYGERKDSASNPTFSDTNDLDYEIYVRPVQYSSLMGISFDDSVFEEIREDVKLKDYLNDYLSSVYGNDCSSGCVIPVSIWGEKNKEGLLKEGFLSYKIKGVGVSQTEDFYDLIRTPAKVTSEDFLSLDIEKAGFEVPDRNGEYDFFLCLNEPESCDEDNSIFDMNFAVDIGFDFDMGPRFSLVKRNTEFEIVTSQSVSQAVWDFGDGSEPVSSEGKTVLHSFENSGDYIIKIGLTNSNGDVSIKKFKVVVGDAKNSVNVTLIDYESRIERLKSSIESFGEFEKSRVKDLIDVSLLERKIKAERENYDRLVGSSLTADEDYISILNKLLVMDVPKNVFIGGSGTLPVQVGYGQDFSGIDLGIIKEATSYSGNFENYAAASNIIQWMEQNYDIKIKFNSVFALGDVEDKELFKTYEIIISELNFEQGSKFLVIDSPLNSINFESVSTAESASGGTFVRFEDDGLSRVRFSIRGPAPEVEDLGVYISPSLSKFDFVPEVRQNWWENKDGSISWWKLIIGL